MATANPEKGEFGVQIGGRPYVLVSTYNGLIALQNLFTVKGDKPSVEAILTRAQQGDLEAIRGVFWSTLLRHHPEITVDQAGDLIQEAGGPGAVDAMLVQSGAASAPDPRDLAAIGGAGPNPPRAARKRHGTSARLQ